MKRESNRANVHFIKGRQWGILSEKARENSVEGSKIFILTDSNTNFHCLPVLLKVCPALANAELLTVIAGESSKTLKSCELLWESMVHAGADRYALFINLGGGMVTDMGGFVASLFKRGIPFIHIPTTLLAMVDAAIGGKTAVNLGALKNQVGLFSEPVAVIIDTVFLKTLPYNELRAGYAEILKIALVRSKNLWNKLKMQMPGEISARAEIIRQAVALKQEVVWLDPEERGLRQLLNFGHTAGHAIESFSLETGHTPILHGDAVAAGILIESWISLQMGLLGEQDFAEILNTFSHFPVFHFSRRDQMQLYNYLKCDKKSKGGRVLCTLLEAPGQAISGKELTKGIIHDAFEWYSMHVKGLQIPAPHD